MILVTVVFNRFGVGVRWVGFPRRCFRLLIPSGFGYQADEVKARRNRRPHTHPPFETGCLRGAAAAAVGGVRVGATPCTRLLSLWGRGFRRGYYSNALSSTEVESSGYYELVPPFLPLPLANEVHG